MKCPYCGYTESRVLDSRRAEDPDSIRRRRECMACLKRFKTYEIIDITPVRVTKKDGSAELFDRNKILAGIMKSCEKRQISRSEMDAVVNDIANEVQNSLNREITTREIGVMVMDRLKKLDDVAYIRFASVYREFKDLRSFSDMLEELERDRNRSEDTENSDTDGTDGVDGTEDSDAENE